MGCVTIVALSVAPNHISVHTASTTCVDDWMGTSSIPLAARVIGGRCARREFRTCRRAYIRGPNQLVAMRPAANLSSRTGIGLPNDEQTSAALPPPARVACPCRVGLQCHQPFAWVVFLSSATEGRREIIGSVGCDRYHKRLVCRDLPTRRTTTVIIHNQIRQNLGRLVIFLIELTLACPRP